MVLTSSFSRVVAATDVDVDLLVAKWVYAVDTLTSQEKTTLSQIVRQSHTNASSLYRIDREVYTKRDIGNQLHFYLGAFSRRDLTQESAGQIAWKSSDGSVLMISHPSRGLDINYKNIKIKSPNFIMPGLKKRLLFPVIIGSIR